MMSTVTVALIVAAYFLFLFGVAFLVERFFARGKDLTDNAVVYTLALAVYCTTWTYYGNVGLAVSNSYLFLGVYLGPTIFFIFWATLLRKIIRIRKAYNITGLADLLSLRYDKSSLVAAIVTIIAVIGIVPYLALQLKAIFSTFALITVGDIAGQVSGGLELMLLFAIIIFTIVFGFRTLNQSERHPGVVIAVVVQSVVKLIAFLVLGIFVTYFLFDGFGDIFNRISQNEFLLSKQRSNIPSYSLFLSHILLSMSAILFLPRQFHIAVVENSNEKHIRTASWLLPAYFILILLFVFPVAMSGILKGYDVALADNFMSLLALREGNGFLAILVFLGGLSAGMSMIIVESIALTTMAANHLALPIIGKFRMLDFLKRRLLVIRWILIAAILFAAYAFEKAIGSSYLLVKIGMISFAAVFQFVPAMIGGLFWKRGNKAGAVLGMSAGFMLWLYTSVLPAFVKSGWLPTSILTDGPYGIALLRPENLFGVTNLDPLANVVLFTMLFNIGGYVLGSILFRQNANERQVPYEFFGTAGRGAGLLGGGANTTELVISAEEKRRILQTVFGKYLDTERAQVLTGDCFEKTGLAGKEKISLSDLINLNTIAEKELSNYTGISVASEAFAKESLFTREESTGLSEVYVQMAARLKLSPEELIQKIDYHAEKEKFLSGQRDELEKMVKDRTRRLEETNTELKKINEMTMGRELRMIELKREIKKLKDEITELNRQGIS